MKLDRKFSKSPGASKNPRGNEEDAVVQKLKEMGKPVTLKSYINLGFNGRQPTPEEAHLIPKELYNGKG